jgi:DNA-binding transcriptional regulator PaaX
MYYNGRCRTERFFDQATKSLLLTLLGEFVLPHGGWIWTSAIVDRLRWSTSGRSRARRSLVSVRPARRASRAAHGGT